MTEAWSQILDEVELAPAEYAVLWHVDDTVVQPRDVLADWTARYLPDVVPPDITLEDCLRAIDSLVERGLLVELSAAEIEADLLRWRNEPLPVSWGVQRDRAVGDIDLTEQGFRRMEAVTRRAFPHFEPSPRMGYNDETPGLIRVLGDSEASCERQLHSVLDRLDQPPWQWPRASVHIAPLRPIGPWWYSRFVRVETGFEIAVRRWSG